MLSSLLTRRWRSLSCFPPSPPDSRLVQATEESPVAALVVRRIGGFFAVVQVDWAVSGPCAGQLASPSTGTLSFPSGTAEATIPLLVKDDTVPELDFACVVQLTAIRTTSQGRGAWGGIPCNSRWRMDGRGVFLSAERRGCVTTANPGLRIRRSLACGEFSLLVPCIDLCSVGFQPTLIHVRGHVPSLAGLGAFDNTTTNATLIIAENDDARGLFSFTDQVLAAVSETESSALIETIVIPVQRTAGTFGNVSIKWEARSPSAVPLPAAVDWAFVARRVAITLVASDTPETGLPSLIFDGLASVADVPAASQPPWTSMSNSSFSIVAAIRQDFNNNGFVFAKTNGTALLYALESRGLDDTLAFYFRDPAGSTRVMVAILGEPLDDFQWHTLSVVVDVAKTETQVTISVDGVSVGPAFVLPRTVWIVDLPGALYLGRGNSSSTRLFRGRMRTVSYYPAVLTSPQLDETIASRAALDLVPASGLVTFMPGQTLAHITIATAMDAIPELEESFSLHLLAADGGARVDMAGRTNNTITISESDDPHGLLSFASTSVSIAEADSDAAGKSVARVTVNRGGGAYGAISVAWSVTSCFSCDRIGRKGCSPCGTPSDKDVSPTSGTVLLAENELSASFFVSSLEDTVPELEERFTVRLANATGGARIDDLGLTSVVAVIANDYPYGLFSLQAINGSQSMLLNENVGNVQLAVIRTAGSNGDVVVSFRTLAGSAQMGVDPQDYYPAFGSVSFADGETSALIDVQIADDDLPEIREDFYVQLTAATDGGTLNGQPFRDEEGSGEVGPTDITGTELPETEATPAPPVQSSSAITVNLLIEANDDHRGVCAFDITSASQVVEEPDGPMTVNLTVNRLRGSFGLVAVTWTAASVGGTGDILESAGFVSFADGVRSGNLTITLLPDTVRLESHSTWILNQCCVPPCDIAL